MTTPADGPPPANAPRLDVTASFAQTDGASATPGCEFGHRSEGTYVCPGTTASLAFYGSSLDIFLNGTTQCLEGVFEVLLDGVDALSPQYPSPPCHNSTHVQRSLAPAAPHVLAIVNGASNATPVLITRAFVENYAAAAVATTSTSAPVRPAPTTDSGPVESSSRMSTRSLLAVILPSILIPILMIALALGTIIPWWRRKRRRQRALMAPSAAFRAENPGLLVASSGAAEPLVPWTPIDAKRGPGETGNAV